MTCNIWWKECLNTDGKSFVQFFNIILCFLYRLDLKVKGQVKLDGKIYETNNEASYKRSYLPLQTGNLKGRVNSVLKEVEFEVKNIKYYLCWRCMSAKSFHNFTGCPDLIIPSVSNRITITNFSVFSFVFFQIISPVLLYIIVSLNL